MSRQIKFRAWDEANKEFIPWENFYCFEDVVDKALYPVEQFTGLHDKNGKEIYEGDVVKIPGHYSGDFWNKEEIKAVEWDGSDCPEGPGFYLSSGDVRWSDCEVIGNIYQNPELIQRDS